MLAANKTVPLPFKFQFRVKGRPGKPPRNDILYTATRDNDKRYLIEWYSPQKQRDSSSYYDIVRVAEFLSDDVWYIVGFENNEEALSLLHKEE